MLLGTELKFILKLLIRVAEVAATNKPVEEAIRGVKSHTKTL